MRPCPQSSELERLAEGLVSDDEADRLHRHAVACSDCRVLLHRLERAAAGEIMAVARVKPGELTRQRDDTEMQSILDCLDMTRDMPTECRPCDVAPAELPNFEWRGLIARGGMGQVWRAWDLKLQRFVAIKLLNHASPDALARLQREMRAIAKLDHPQIVRAFQAGESDGTSFLAMEFVEGANLSELEKAVRPLAIADACELTRQLAAALQHVHDLHMIHRDVKPGNAMLGVDGKVKLLDLGLAAFREPGEASVELTVQGQLLGTIEYMAPEQLAGSGQLSIKTDIHGLGATLYRLLTGQSPFGRYQAIMQRMEAVRMGDYLPLDQLRDDLPPELISLVHRMLATNPQPRPNTAAEVVTALEPFARGADLVALAVRAGQLQREAIKTQQPVESTNAHAVAVSSNANRLRALMFLLAPMVIVVCLAGWWTWWQAGSRSPLVPNDNGNTKVASGDDRRAEFKMLHSAIDELSDLIANDPELNKPGLMPLRREMLNRLRQSYAEARDEFGADPDLLYDLGHAYQNLGLATLAADSSQASLPIFEQALAIRRELHALEPDSPVYSQGVAGSLLGIGVIRMNLGEPELAVAAVGEALNIYEGLVQSHPDNSQFVEELGMAYLNQSWLQEKLANYEAARETAVRGAATLRPLVAADPANAHRARLLALQYQNKGSALANLKRYPESLAAFDEAITMMRRLCDAYPDDEENRARLGTLLIGAGETCRAAAELDRAENLLHDAVAIMERLRRERPGVVFYERDYAQGATQLAMVLHAKGRDAEARIMHELATASAENVFAREKGATESREELTAAYEAFARFLDEISDPSSAAEIRQRLQRLLEESADEPTSDN